MEPISFPFFMANSIQAPRILQSGVVESDTVTLSATPASGSLIVGFGVKTGGSVATPSGYTNIADHTGSAPRIKAFYKVSNGTETNIVSSTTEIMGYCVFAPGVTLDVTGSTVRTSPGPSSVITGITPARNSTVLMFGGYNGTTPAGATTATNFPQLVINTPTSLTTSTGEMAVLARIGYGFATGSSTLTFSAGTGDTVGVMFSVK